MLRAIPRALAFLLLLAAAPARAASPPLTVVFVVDQMRADYLSRFGKEFTGGFARFLRDGAVFQKARQGHVPTETAPGHAAIATGRFPAQSGIVGNEWWDRASGKDVKSIEDKEYGSSPRSLQTPTLGDALKEMSPSSRVVSLAGKDRAAILMGGKRPDLALWYDTNAGQFVSDAYYGRLPDWVWTWDAGLRIPVLERAPLTFTPRLDSLLLELARRAVEEQKLGQGTGPDLLFLGLSATDYIGHKNGPDSPEIHSQLLALDKELGVFLDFLDAKIGRGRYVAALSADHGVMPVPEGKEGKALGLKRVMLADFKGRIESALRTVLGPPEAGKSWLLEVHSPHVWLNLPLAREHGIESRLLEEARKALLADPAVAAVLGQEELAHGRGRRIPEIEAFRRGYFPERSGDLMILVKKNVYLTSYKDGTGHGLPYDFDARVPLILLGAGVRPGRYSKPALATDIAPTLSRLLELPFEPVEGSRVLQEGLDQAEGGRPRK